MYYGSGTDDVLSRLTCGCEVKKFYTGNVLMVENVKKHQ